MNQAGVAEPRVSTRDRILQTCRELFNENGPAEVTTAEIAEALGISEGNLHYHFRRKDQILAALFDQFETAVEQTGRATADRRDGPEPELRYLLGWFNTMWEWRLFYGAGIYRLAPELQPRLMEITGRGQAHVRHFLQELARDGVLRLQPHDIEPLVVNSWIIGVYWVSYVRSSQGVRAITRAHLGWGFAQVRALFKPYAVEAGAPGSTP